ncbi:unnamed protein product [Hymenolepis diminuta]|uniref:Uncharacterized protein n=1 Tax=Hymenolepis diminuta TaxID=6216 RepID=A0A564Y3M0_HYMDI|nr:unnamed protein product [Hymenolepis diminuta]
MNGKTCRRWFLSLKKYVLSLKDESGAGFSENSILNNCKLPLMKIQPPLLEN